MNRQEIEERLLEFHSNLEIQKYLLKLRTPSFFDIIGMSRIEATHSNVLAWLFSKNFHGIPMCGLMTIIAKRMISQQPMNGIQLDILSNLSSLQIEKVETEVSIDKDKKEESIDKKTAKKAEARRMDIVIRCALGGKPYIIVIENKVDSKEHNEQTQAYYDYINSRPEYQEAGKVFLYLTPLSGVDLEEKVSKRTVPECVCKEYVQICYQDIMDQILTPLVKVGDLDSRSTWLIREYIKCLGPTENKEQEPDELMKETAPMALDRETGVLLRGFWMKNKDLIMVLKELNAADKEGNEVKNMDSGAQELLRAFWKENKDLIMVLMEVIAADTKQTLSDREAARSFIRMEKYQFIIEYRGNTYGPYLRNSKNCLAVKAIEIYAKANPSFTATYIQNAMPECSGIFDKKMRSDRTAEIKCANNTKFWVKNDCYSIDTKTGAYGSYLKSVIQTLKDLEFTIL